MRHPTLIAVFSTLVILVAIWAIRFSPHPAVWMIGLLVSIVVFAAIAGATMKSTK